MEIRFSTLKNIIQRKEILIVIICMVLGFSLRFYTFDQKSLWIDEIHTYNDSKDGFEDQVKYYKEEPGYLHPPLFFLLTHLFYPFEKPERDLRIIPLIFGTLSIPMIYLLSRSFSPGIAMPCAVSLAFMTYHISFSQDGRPYSFLMFLGMVGLYFFMWYLKTLKRGYLILVAACFSALFHVSYVSIPFIALSQILWFYGANEDEKKHPLYSFLLLNGLTLLLCLPWIFFIAVHYQNPPMMDRMFIEEIGSLWRIISGILNDWVPFLPLMIVSLILLCLLPIFSKNRRNAIILLAILTLPVVLIYFSSKLLNINHFFSSRYLINFLPLFFIAVYLSLDTLESKLEGSKRIFRPTLLFLILFIASNMMILPLYYRSEKQDFRGLVTYLGGQIRDGDTVFVQSVANFPGLLHYFKVNPGSRHYNIPFYWIDSEKNEFESKISLTDLDKRFTICYSNSSFLPYITNENRLWIVVGKRAAKEIKEKYPFILKGYFDGTFCNFRRFPSDASMYLFLSDPKSPGERGIDLIIE